MTLPDTLGELIRARGANIDSKSLFPYYPLVPKGPAENAEFREWLRAVGDADEDGDRGLILEACAADLLFLINSLLWIKQESPIPADLPFVTWPRQDEYCELLARTRRDAEADKSGVVRGDTLAEKPREVGWSWLNLAEGLQIARFTRGATCLIGSRVESDVDATGSSRSLFWKLDYYLANLPEWFMPAGYFKPYPNPAKKFRTSGSGKIRLGVPGFGTFLGSPTHENFGRAGRFAWMLLDEFAHTDRGQAGMGEKIWSSTTKTCRLRRVVSTPNGRDNKFASLRASGSLPVFTVQWSDDPAKTVGAYELTESLAVGPVTLPKGALWSPWMDATRKADDNDALFAQEILLSYEGVGGSFYETLLDRVREEIREPLWRGNVKLSPDSKRPTVGSLEASPQGYFKCWEWWDREEFSRTGTVRWTPGIYVAGIDVASGSRDEEGRGASNSVWAVGRVEDQKLKKIAEYKTHGLLPHLFARIVCALGWCFPWPPGMGGRVSGQLPAYTIWELNGPGDMMGQTLVREHGYPHPYWGENAGGSRLGFQMQTYRLADGKLAGSRVNVFNYHKQCLERGWYQEPCFETYREMEQYKYTADGAAEHGRCRASLDPSEGRTNHGDAVIGTILMLWAAKDLRERSGERSIEPAAPVLSVAWAQKKRRREAATLWR